MNRLRDESGQVMVLTILSMAVLIGFVAFAVDIGMLLHAKRVMQTAADSAAIAAAAEIPYGDYATAAQIDASQNGVTDGVNGATVATHDPPQSGWLANQPGYVQVTVSEPQPTFFIQAFESLFGNPSLGTMTVSASATATRAPTTICIYAISQNPLGGVGIQTSGGTLSAPTCGIQVNAPGSGAITTAGGSNIVAESVSVVGGVNTSGGGSITPLPVTGALPLNDPLAYLTPPQPSSCQAATTISTSQTLPPPTGGIACYNGLSISGSNTVVTMPPGVYVFTGIPGSLQISGGATLAGTGVTLYFSGLGQFQAFGANTTLNLAAPTTGSYNGILMYQDANDPNYPVFINVSGTLNGIVYAPQTQIFLENQGSPGLNVSNVSFVVSYFNTQGNINVQGYAPAAGNIFPPIYSPRLAE